MIVSVNQPYFAPYPGFFVKALHSDVMVLLDDVQFPQGTTWISRNRFKNDQGTLWLTIPVWKKGLGKQRISEVRICREGRWLRKHLESLKCAYANAPFFDEHLDFLSDIFSGRYEKLISLNLDIIRYLAGYLNIGTKIICQSDIGTVASGTRLVVDICRTLGASGVAVQSAARKHLDNELLAVSGIGLTVFKTPQWVYPQLWGAFVPNLSVFDLIFTCGPKAGRILAAAPF